MTTLLILSDALTVI